MQIVNSFDRTREIDETDGIDEAATTSKHLNPSSSPSRTPSIEVIKICVSFYLADIKGAQMALERVTEHFIKTSETLRGIDYSRKLGIDATPTFSMSDEMARRIEAYAVYVDVCAQVDRKIREAQDIIASIEHGDILWLQYVDGMQWGDILARSTVSSSTLWRWRTAAMTELYHAMPEEYRRYSIPNAATL